MTFGTRVCDSAKKKTSRFRVRLSLRRRVQAPSVGIRGADSLAGRLRLAHRGAQLTCESSTRIVAGGRDAAARRAVILCGSQLPPDRVSHRGYVIGPVEAVAAQQHVPDERLDRRLAHQPHEEELLDHLRRDRAQGRQSQQQLAEPRRLVRILRPAVLLQRALRLLLEGLDVRHVRETAGVCNKIIETIFSLYLH